MKLFNFWHTETYENILCELGNLNKKLDWITKNMATEAELDAKLVELKQAIADAAQRVLDKLATISTNNPDLSDELADVTADVEAQESIAPAEPTP